jgi:hypothetical protein
MRYEDLAARTLSQLLFFERFWEKSWKAGEVQSALLMGAAVLAAEEEEAYQLEEIGEEGVEEELWQTRAMFHP